MIPERRPLFLEVLDHEEYVEVDVDRDAEGRIVNATPIEGTRTAFLHLKSPSGSVLRAEISHEHLYPLLALMIPDFTA